MTNLASKKHSKLTTLLLCAVTLLIILALGALCSSGFVFAWRLQRKLENTERVLCGASAADAAGRLLSNTLSYSRGEELPRDLGVSWLSDEFGDERPFYISKAGDDSVRIEFGGGFHHIGYLFEERTAEKDGRDGGYELNFYSEGFASQLSSFDSLPSRDKARLNLLEIIDKSYGDPTQNFELHHYESFVSAYIWVGENDKAIEAVLRAGKHFPSEWWPKLAILCLMDDEFREEKLAEMTVWKNKNRTVERVFCYCWALERHGKVDQCMDELGDFETVSHNTSGHPPANGDTMCVELALMAMRHGRFAIAKDIVKEILKQRSGLPKETYVFASTIQKAADEALLQAASHPNQQLNLKSNEWVNPYWRFSPPVVRECGQGETPRD